MGATDEVEGGAEGAGGGTDGGERRGRKESERVGVVEEAGSGGLGLEHDEQPTTS